MEAYLLFENQNFDFFVERLHNHPAQPNGRKELHSSYNFLTVGGGGEGLHNMESTTIYFLNINSFTTGSMFLLNLKALKQK